MGAVAFLVSDINLAMWEVAVCGAIRVSQLRNGAFLPVLNPSKNRHVQFTVAHGQHMTGIKKLRAVVAAPL